MKTILSAHFDLKKPVSFIKLEKKYMTGLLDNFAGIFAAYSAARSTNAELYLTNFEEENLGGAIKVAKKLKGQDVLVIVVDICSDVPQNKIAYFGNAYHINTQPLQKVFGKKIFFKDGLFEPNEDETAVYGADYHFPTFFFGVPIAGKYHDTNNKIALSSIDDAGKLLVDLIGWLNKNKKVWRRKN